ncbi:hypothetical protein AA313_de0208225 [Arthrobotrys entomopaga]|nr:hypothetical protein AA313_de0208225 [Arthrobotrys entomopaga]
MLCYVNIIMFPYHRIQVPVVAGSHSPSCHRASLLFYNSMRDRGLPDSRRLVWLDAYRYACYLVILNVRFEKCSKTMRMQAQGGKKNRISHVGGPRKESDLMPLSPLLQRSKGSSVTFLFHQISGCKNKKVIFWLAELIDVR